MPNYGVCTRKLSPEHRLQFERAFIDGEFQLATKTGEVEFPIMHLEMDVTGELANVFMTYVQDIPGVCVPVPDAQNQVTRFFAWKLNENSNHDGENTAFRWHTDGDERAPPSFATVLALYVPDPGYVLPVNYPGTVIRLGTRHDQKVDSTFPPIAHIARTPPVTCLPLTLPTLHMHTTPFSLALHPPDFYSITCSLQSMWFCGPTREALCMRTLTRGNTSKSLPPTTPCTSSTEAEFHTQCR
jgi:hypothetical protein